MTGERFERLAGSVIGGRLRILAKRCQSLAWLLKAHLDRRVSLAIPQKATVIIPTYSIERARRIGGAMRGLLRCEFVATLIVSNHNPDIRIEDHVRVHDPRVVLLNQPTRRGCGYQWTVAAQRAPEFLISIDDDIRLLPAQLALLFERLVAEPEIPHGLMGICRGQFFQNRDMQVDLLNQVYAISAEQLRVYAALVDALTTRRLVAADTIEFWGDDIVISHAGIRPPKIHAAGAILRCATANDPRIATYKQAQFCQRRAEVHSALAQLLTPGHAPGEYESHPDGLPSGAR